MLVLQGKRGKTALLDGADGNAGCTGCPTLGSALIDAHPAATDQITQQILHKYCTKGRLGADRARLEDKHPEKGQHEWLSCDVCIGLSLFCSQEVGNDSPFMHGMKDEPRSKGAAQGEQDGAAGSQFGVC